VACALNLRSKQARQLCLLTNLVLVGGRNRLKSKRTTQSTVGMRHSRSLLLALAGCGAAARAGTHHHDGSGEDLCPEAKAMSRLQLTGKEFFMGCDPLVVWQLAQLTMPGAKHFLEAGTNLGFYGARIHNLW